MAMKLKGGFSVSGGKLVGRTGDTEYFFFTCPKCPDEQVMRVLDYEFRDDAPPIVRDEKKVPKKHFNLAFSLYCPNCQFEDFIKIDNNHQAGPLKPK
jgi:predicted RNA-binding Zn-ribbon protein involved in translation (DUF1610 family)